MPKEIERTAYHEAGHAVAAHLLEVPFEYITIKVDEERGSLGSMLRVEKEGFKPEVDADDETLRNVIEARAMVCMAGPEAEKSFAGEYDDVGATSDRHFAADWVSRATCGDAKEEDAYLNWLTNRVRSRLSKHCEWKFVQAVAKALLEHETLSAKRVREIIAETSSRLVSADRSHRGQRNK